jgi:hypothetical protein
LPRLYIPVFLLLLPIFFVLHGMTEQSGFVPLKDALLLLLIYSIAALALFALCRLLFRDNVKAAIAAFLLLGFHFFFGSMHDALITSFNNSFITKYSFLLPFFLIVFVIAFILIRRTTHNFKRLSKYLTVLLLLLIAWDTVNFFIKKSGALITAQLPGCDTCSKPDVYLILLDEYAGHQSLKDIFSFDNSGFETQLTQRGFHVVNNSRSNYNYTPFSMASMLNLRYLHLQNTERSKPDLSYALSAVNDNLATKIFAHNGYEFFNYSPCDIGNQPTPNEETFMPAKTKLITAQTFLSRLQRDLGYHLVKLSPATGRAYRELRNNDRLYELTATIAAKSHEKPVFVYTHFMMPHYPYYFDRDGKPMDPARVLPEGNNANKKDYVEYLQYANKKIIQLTDHILRSSEKPPVIIIMSDHGFRHFTPPVDQQYHFMDLNAIYLPAKNYNGFYDGITNVNQFRVLFNTLFNTKFPVLKDSSIYLKD